MRGCRECGAGLPGFVATPVNDDFLWKAPGDEYGNSQPNRIKRTYNRSRIFLEEVKGGSENRVNAAAV